LLARSFLQRAKAGHVTLSADTKKNVIDLFKEIEFKHEN
jgi:hypothetical protein